MPNHYDAEWAAWLNTMPGSAWKLHVKGTLQMPTPGYTLELKRHDPQGITETVLLLDLIVTPPDPDMIVPTVITPEEVRYEEETATRFTTVTVLPDGTDIPVEIVS